MYVELKYLHGSVSITTQLKYDHRNWSTAFQITPHILEYCLHLSQALYIFLSNHVSSGVFCNVNCNTGVLSCRLEYCSLGTDVHTSVLFAECCILARNSSLHVLDGNVPGTRHLLSTTAVVRSMLTASMSRQTKTRRECVV